MTPALPSRRLQFLLATAILVALALLCWHFDVSPHHYALKPLPDVLRGIAGIAVVFGLTGFGPVRLLLPDRLRRHELLWIVPTGGCAAGLELTVLGFAGVPYAVALTLVLAVGVALSAFAVRRRGWPSLQLGAIGWPAYLGWVVLTVTLVPLIFVQHYTAITGTGSDAHLAAGVAQFLKDTYPTSVNLHEPINQMQPTWQSKYPIYYAFAAVSSVSGLATWQVMPILIGSLFALAAVGLYLLAVEVLAAPVAVAITAMLLAGLDRMALHTPLNPYFNQTYGYFTMPFTVVLGWIAVQPGLSRSDRRGVLGLLLIFALVLVLAYPLAAPIPAVPLLAFVVAGAWRRHRSGQGLLPKSLPRGWRSLLWIVPLCVALAIPLAGAVDKMVQFAKELAPGAPINGSWKGDIDQYFPWNWFFSLPNSWLGYVLFAGIVVLALVGLWRQPRPLAIGLAILLALSLAFAVYLRHLDAAFYIEFKLLAFAAPLLILVAVLGAFRLRWPGLAALAVLLVALGVSVRDELAAVGYQLPRATVALSSWAKALPPNASVRLDLAFQGDQLWVAYFMDARPLCSQLPLLATDYPHVPVSRKADYILTMFDVPHPKDAVGPPVRRSLAYILYRENPRVPGPSYCSYRRYDRLYTGAGFSRF